MIDLKPMRRHDDAHMTAEQVGILSFITALMMCATIYLVVV